MDYLHKREGPDYKTREDVLHALVCEAQNHAHSEFLNAFLLVLFYPVLDRIYHEAERKISYLKLLEPLDIYLQTQKSFLETVRAVNLSRDTGRLIAKLIWSTRNKMRHWCKKQLKQESGKDAADIGTAASLVIHSTENAENLLNSFVQQKIITESDKHMLLETRVKGKSLRKFSEETKMNYARLRQRRLRVEKKVRAFLNKEKIF